jgi:hypothetical protein
MAKIVGRSRGPRARWVLSALLGLGVLALVFTARYGAWAVAEPAPAYEIVALPEGIDTLSSLAVAVNGLAACDAECAGIIYFWSPRMPLSRAAIPNIVQAARTLGADLTLVGFEELERYAEGGGLDGSESAKQAETILVAGALTHAPSLVVHQGRQVVGPAIIGYKEAAAYETMIARRLSRPPAWRTLLEKTSLLEVSGVTDLRRASFTDYRAIGVPGAYFRWVPGRQAIAYESAGRIYLMDLADGETSIAPGYVDFVPTPDGRYFVTPGQRNEGLVFYDADEIFEASASGRGGAVRPIFRDDQMRDQYPSVGILAQDESSVRYRVMTSWFEGLVYRDYEIRDVQRGGPATVRALGAPVVPCDGMELSTPIMSQDGTEVAARDEASGTTKIFSILPGGRCEEALALGMPTRKVAWHSSGRKLAFSTPRVRSASTGDGGAEPGIFVYDRDERRVTRVADSEGASQLAFPDFVGEDAVTFMVPGRTYGEQSFFRLVEPLP